MEKGKYNKLLSPLLNLVERSGIVFDFLNAANNAIFVEKSVNYECLKSSIHSDDMDYLKKVFEVVRDTFQIKEIALDEIDHFAFLLQLGYDFSSKGEYVYCMTYVRLIPLLKDGELLAGYCQLSASIQRKQDNKLIVYYKNKDYSIYSFSRKEWMYYQYSPLTARQKEMLIWARQGYSLKETAEKMNISSKTIQNMRRIVFEKFGVSSIEQALQYASNRQLMDLVDSE